MSKRKQLMLMATCGVLSVSTAYASPTVLDDDEATSGDVTFSASVEKQCGIDVTAATADLAFGDTYLDSTAQVKLINNEKNGKVLFRLDTLGDGALTDNVSEEEILFKTEGAIDLSQDSKAWQEGEEISRGQLKQNNLIDIAARVAVDESDLDADDYVLVTNWIIECDD